MKNAVTLLTLICSLFILAPAQAGFLDGLVGLPQISDIYKSNELVKLGEEGSRLTVLGIVSSTGLITDEQELAYGNMLAQSLRFKNRHIRVEGPVSLERALGKSTAQNLLDDYKDLLHLDLPHLSIIEKGYPAATHILVVRMDRNRVSRDKSRFQYDNKDKPDVSAHYDRHGNLQIDNFSMKSSTVTAMDTYSTTRDMAIFVEIYDVVQGITVWSGHVHKRATKSYTRSNTYSSSSSKRLKQQLGEAVAAGIISGITGSEPLQEEDYYPEVTASDELLEELIHRFSSHLKLEHKKRR